MATIGTYNFINHYKGDTFKGAQFTFLNETTSSPIDLTGTEIRMQFRKGRKNGAVKATLDLTDGLTLTDASNGILTVDPFIIDFEADVHYYDIQVTYADGTIKTYVQGKIKVIQDVTRD